MFDSAYQSLEILVPSVCKTNSLISHPGDLYVVSPTDFIRFPQHLVGFMINVSETARFLPMEMFLDTSSNMAARQPS